jgi:LysR family transcriptional regulator, transcriptional activator of the cysJI operon
MSFRLDLTLLDPTSLHAFWAVSETLNFTRAARIAGMTQSGVSQHIAKLERALGAKLFARTQREIKLTAEGEALREFVQSTQDRYELLREHIQTEREVLRGEVRYAMPPSCVFSSHLRLLLQHRRDHFPLVTLDVRVCDNREIESRVLDADVHFGFMTTRPSSKAVERELYCREGYVLVGRVPRVIREVEALRALPVIRYPGAEVAFQIWASAQFPRRRVRFEDLPTAATINDLAGVLALLTEGVGWTVVAQHVAAPLLAENKLVVIEPRPVLVDHRVYLVTRSAAHLPARARAVMNGFRAILGTGEQ